MPVPLPCRPSARLQGKSDRFRRAASLRRIAGATQSPSSCVCDQFASRVRLVTALPLMPCRFSHSLPQCFRKEIAWLHAMRRVVRTSIDAAGLGLLGAEVASGGLLLYHRLLLSRML